MQPLDYGYVVKNGQRIQSPTIATVCPAQLCNSLNENTVRNLYYD